MGVAISRPFSSAPWPLCSSLPTERSQRRPSDGHHIGQENRPSLGQVHGRLSPRTQCLRSTSTMSVCACTHKYQACPKSAPGAPPPHRTQPCGQLPRSSERPWLPVGAWKPLLKLSPVVAATGLSAATTGWVGLWLPPPVPN